MGPSQDTQKQAVGFIYTLCPVPTQGRITEGFILYPVPTQDEGLLRICPVSTQDEGLMRILCPVPTQGEELSRADHVID